MYRVGGEEEKSVYGHQTQTCLSCGCRLKSDGLIHALILLNIQLVDLLMSKKWREGNVIEKVN